MTAVLALRVIPTKGYSEYDEPHVVESVVYDLALDPHLALTEDLDTAVALSLLTEKRAVAGQVSPGQDRRGWWGDTYSDGDAFGSWLWTLEGRERTDETRSLAEAYARDALQWMLTDKIADALQIQSEFTRKGIRVRVGIVHGTALRWLSWWERTL